MAKKAYWQNGNNLWVTSKDMKSDRIGDSKLKISDEALSIMTVYEPGILLLVTRSGILRHSMPLAILEKQSTVNQDIKTISLFVSELNEFVFYSIKARESFILKDYHKDGTTVDSIDFDKFSNILLPIPPLNEQIRIVKMIGRLFSSIDEIKQNKTDIHDIVKKTKTKILDLAIHGKLVEQDPNDEPAGELLKRIAPNAKPCDTSHYMNIPQGWTISTVGKVAKYINGRAFKPIEWEQEGLPIIRIQNLNDGNASYNYTTATYEDRYLIKDGDLLFAWAASLGTYIWNGGDAWLNQHIFKVEPKDFMDKSFLYYSFVYLISEFYRQSHGSGMVHITKGKFENTPILIPPLNEQKRIVAALEEVIKLIDTIDS